MPHTALLGDVEVPITYSKDEAVGLMQEAGIVGAGGAGFPTYIKYDHVPHTLLVNAAESEPGYYKDKLLLRDEPEALIDVFEWLKRTFSIETIVVGAEEVARPYMWQLEQLARKLHNFSVAYFEPLYKYGQERALCKAVLGMRIPATDLPMQHGVVVSNVETLFNIYRAVFEGQSVITKFLHVYGEATPLGLYEAPVGTLAADLLRIHGHEPADLAGCKLYDGGPVLADLAADPMGEEPLVPVQRTTNAFLVTAPGKDKLRSQHYPDAGFKEHHNSIDAPWAPDGIVNVEDRVPRVRVPLHGRFWKAGRVVVEVGDRVKRNQDIAPPALEGRSVGVQASIDGKVTAVTPDYVEIVR